MRVSRLMASALLIMALWTTGCELQPANKTPPPGPTETVEKAKKTEVEPTKPEPTESPKTEEKEATMGIKKEPFGKTKDGQEVTLYTVTNKNGLVLKMIDYGATVVSME